MGAAEEPVILVRDRDMVYGDCLLETPQPAIRAWRSPTRVRQANALNTNMKNVGLARSAEAYIRVEHRRAQGRVWVGGEADGADAPCRR